MVKYSEMYPYKFPCELETTCGVCGKQFKYIAGNSWSRPRTCSQECKGKGRIIRLEQRYTPRNSDLINTRSSYIVFKRDNFKCIYCGASSLDGAKLTIDHIDPVSELGVSTIDNLVTACSECNFGKSDNCLDSENYRLIKDEVHRRNELYSLNPLLVLKVGDR